MVIKCACNVRVRGSLKERAVKAASENPSNICHYSSCGSDIKILLSRSRGHYSARLNPSNCATYNLLKTQLSLKTDCSDKVKLTHTFVAWPAKAKASAKHSWPSWSSAVFLIQLITSGLLGFTQPRLVSLKGFKNIVLLSIKVQHCTDVFDVWGSNGCKWR